MQNTLYYVHDPMCSWCWAFRPVLQTLQQRLPGRLGMVKLLGGLAPDTDQPMEPAMREYLQQTWRRIATQVPGTRFNHAFWQRNVPRRATYPACRAVLAAREQQADEAMLEAIQHAYYLQARNPSEEAVLIALATEIGLDAQRFARALESAHIQQQLQHEIAQARALGVDSYPALVLAGGDRHWPLPIDYNSADNMLANLAWLLEEVNGGD